MCRLDFVPDKIVKYRKQQCHDHGIRMDRPPFQVWNHKPEGRRRWREAIVYIQEADIYGLGRLFV